MSFRGRHLYTNGPEVQGAFGVDSLPLTTVAHIISYLEDDATSLARLCRTSRVLYYMTLPQLWKHVVLRSHCAVHYRDDVPEGLGSASPFSMGLNALVTRNVAALVSSLVLEGDYKSLDLEEYSRAGRVSESTMILNIAIRAAINQCIQLEKFRWDLNVRIQANVYAGLGKLSRLESLWIRFQTNRLPQPHTEIPALPNLRSFTFTHYDPMCYPDDVSTLFLNSEKLEVLNMHFSPRMREQGEASVVLARFFRKNMNHNKKIRLKHVGVYNLLATSESAECMAAMDARTIESFTALNTFGVDEDELHRSNTLFIDRTWFLPNTKEAHNTKCLRMDQLHKIHAQEIATSPDLERLYLINARYRRDGVNGESSPSSVDASPRTVNGDTNRSSRSTPTYATAPMMSLRDAYLDSICNGCGPKLKHLIFPARWPLHSALTAKLIRSCPNLTQFSAAIPCSDMEVLRMVIPFLTKLWAIRVVAPRTHGEEGEKALGIFNACINQPDSVLEEDIAKSLRQRGPAGGVPDFPSLRYIGMGHKVWEVGSVYEEKVKVRSPAQMNTPEESSDSSYYEETIYHRKLKRITERDVSDVEIWKMDTMDIA
ncbi:hypothetical protein PV08_02172 [Exophiala spinifera]|uniref:F-box domain-containing protein n=1 Tax=Exophiala spinifera TaxID=91928 RepID=A0A0D2AA16_9EURO|nr:uncharacterized protein PV08_02172 [Exophiala spinifera]KIW21592.1 hypothetical protein PV08_02172 [Exophiala spinifera]